jgi:hypothetical protein
MGEITKFIQFGGVGVEHGFNQFNLKQEKKKPREAGLFAKQRQITWCR